MRTFLLLLIFFPWFICAQSADSTQRAPQPIVTTTATPTSKVEILFADKISGTPEIRTLTGNVHLKQADTQLWADEVVQFIQKGEVTLKGNVRIKQGNDSLFADFIRYIEATRVADATGNIRLDNGTNTVFAPSGRYYIDEKKVEYFEGARILDDNAVINSTQGTYFTQTRTANFQGNVQFTKGETQVTANKGTYRADEKRSFFEENVRFVKGKTVVLADKGSYDEGQKYANFEGNVRFQSEGARLSAHTGTYNEQTQIADFEGNIRYEKGDQSLTAESGQYFEQEKRATFTQNVQYKDRKMQIRADNAEVFQEEERSLFTQNVILLKDDMQLETPYLAYAEKEDLAKFESGVLIKDNKGTLKANRGVYKLEQKESRFFGNIELTRDRFYLKADTLTDFSERQQSFAYGKVFVRQISKDNPNESNLLWGGQLVKDEKNGLTQMQRNPILLQQKNKNNSIDSLWVRAETLKFIEKESDNSFIADERVRVYRKTFSAVSDSMFVAQKNGQEDLHLIGNAIAWQDDMQIIGTEISLFRHQNQTDSLKVNAALIAQQDSTLKTFRQLKGKTAFGHFQADSLRQLRLSPQAELLDFIGKEGKLDKAIKATADQMFFNFANGDLQNMDAIGNVQGKLYEQNLIPQNFQLDGFIWQIDKKPKPTDFTPLF